MPQKKESLLGNVLSFFLRPTYIEEPIQKPIHKKIFDTLRVVALSAFFMVPFIIIIIILNAVFKLDTSNVLGDLIKTTPTSIIFLLLVIIAPLTEELTFRFGLRFTKFNVSISLSFIIIIFTDLLKLVLGNLKINIIPEWLFTVSNLYGIVSLLTFVFLASSIVSMLVVF